MSTNCRFYAFASYHIVFAVVIAVLLYLSLLNIPLSLDTQPTKQPSISLESIDKHTTPFKQIPKQFTSAKTSAPSVFKRRSLDDWNNILQSGVLRIIVPYSYQHNDFLPRKFRTYNDEMRLILRFAENHGLVPLIITAKEYGKLLPSLEFGYGDVVVANLTVTKQRKSQVSFTYPVTHTIEQLVVSDKFNLISKQHDNELLNELTIGVAPGTSYWETINSLKPQYPQLKIREFKPNITVNKKYSLLFSGQIDAIIEDSNRIEIINKHRNDIKSLLDLTDERPIAWAVRQDNPELLKQLNHFIQTEKILQHLPKQSLGDLDSIKKNNQLRLITRNNASTYFLWKNELMGFEYELMKKFAQEQDVNLKVLVADSFEQMLQWLQNGHGDVIAAGLIKTPERENLPVIFTEPYLFVHEQLVQRKSEPAITQPHELDQRSIAVRPSSSYWHTLLKLQDQLHSQNIHFYIDEAPEEMETEAVIQSVRDETFDMTVSDSHIIAIEKNWNKDIQSTLSLTNPRGQRWLVRKQDKQLHNALNKFIKKHYKGLFYNVVHNKYFKNSHDLFDTDTRHDNDNKISQFDDLIKSLAQEYNLDWRMVSAQVNKESRFNPKAKSWAGAIGLLQVMPRTAKEVGITQLDSPEHGLRAGLEYMKWINEQLSEELPADVRTWFTLAAYNAGLGHLKDARKLAKEKGYNPNRWFGHVEKAFLLLSKRKYHKKARYGYVRGIEPVIYVKQIQAIYKLYSRKYPDNTTIISNIPADQSGT